MTILEHTNGNPCIADHRVAHVPKVIPVLFDSPAAAQSFVASARKTGVVPPYEGFWCNFSRTKADRESFKQNVQPLLKTKLAICEATNTDGSLVVVDKNSKMVYFVEGSTLRFVAEMISKDNIRWEDSIKDEVRELAKSLISEIR